mmetsp:Transcript_113157/g.320259  ORF Transcript_113157/g.320259 Transcript_113157/m.320259 type:complete len:98 (+) Transcript_113157:1119-1412(+)
MRLQPSRGAAVVLPPMSSSVRPRLDDAGRGLYGKGQLAVPEWKPLEVLSDKACIPSIDLDAIKRLLCIWTYPHRRSLAQLPALRSRWRGFGQSTSPM